MSIQQKKMDSGVSQPLQNPFIRSSIISSSPIRSTHPANQQENQHAERIENMTQVNRGVARENANLKKSLENLMQLNGQLFKEFQQLKEEIVIINNEKQGKDPLTYETDED